MKFRKKPVVVEAVPVAVVGSVILMRTAPQWLADATFVGTVVFSPPGAVVLTREGRMYANPDDWLIQGVKGEIYPCKPDIFAATYEPVEEPQP